MTSTLPSRDLRAILRVLPRLYAPAGPDVFPQVAMAVVCELLAAPYISYDEVDPTQGVVLNQLNREPPMPYGDFVSGWEQHVDEHPCIRYTKGGGTKPVVTISDFLSDREFQNTGLYRDCFEPGGMTHQLAMNLPAPRDIVGMGITRDADFTDRERAIAELLRPHMAQARINSFFFAPPGGGAAVSRDEMIVPLDENGVVRAWPHRIQLVLVEYFDCQFRGRWAAPQKLLLWAEAHFAKVRSGDVRPSTFAPLSAHRDTKTLTVRFFYSAEGTAFLTFEENIVKTDAQRFSAIGLTQRESEILTWVAEGKRDAEIAQIVGSSARTVSNHVYRILKKLGVETRTAAAAEAEVRLRREG